MEGIWNARDNKSKSSYSLFELVGEDQQIVTIRPITTDVGGKCYLYAVVGNIVTDKVVAYKRITVSYAGTDYITVKTTTTGIGGEDKDYIEVPATEFETGVVASVNRRSGI